MSSTTMKVAAASITAPSMRSAPTNGAGATAVTPIGALTDARR
jgi:hypothetical protein